MREVGQEVRPQMGEGWSGSQNLQEAPATPLSPKGSVCSVQTSFLSASKQ